MTVPTTVARRAVRIYHQQGAAAANAYIASSKVAQWAGHSNPSMASGARNVIDGVAEYMVASRRDQRVASALDQETVCTLPSGQLRVRVDVVLEDGNKIAGRVVLWDGPNFEQGQVPLMAAVYSQALVQLYPGRDITGVAIWQGRRHTRAEVSFAAAQAELGHADRIVASL